MNFKVFALVCLAACLAPMALGQEINFGAGPQIDGKDVTCPGGEFGDITGNSCTCKDGSPCRTDDGAADDEVSPSPTPSPTPSPSSSSTAALSAVATVAIAGLLL